MPFEVFEDGSLTFTRGDTGRILLEFYEDDDITPVNKTGSTWKAQVRTEPGGYKPFEFVPSFPEPHQVLLSCEHDDTKGIQLEEFMWDVEETTAAGFVETHIGPATVTVIKDLSI